MVVATTPAISADLERLLVEVARQLQLPKTAESALRSEFSKLTRYLTVGNLAGYQPSLYAQGSFRIGTTVRPLGGEEFDLDFIVELLAPPSHDPTHIYELVARELERHPDYRGHIERKDRCIRLSFPGQYHIDVVPAVPAVRDGIEIPDKGADGLSWKYTDPKGYIRWFEAASLPTHLRKEHASVAPLPPEETVLSKTALQVGVQLLKRHHQLHTPEEKLRTPSIVLTTIAGLDAAGHDSLGGCMNDIVAGILVYARTPRHVFHPTAQDEMLSDKWNDSSVFSRYQNTSEKMASQWEQVVSAQGQGIPIVAQLLNEMFGNEIVQRAIKAVGTEAGSMKKQGRLAAGAGGGVSIVAKGRGDKRGTFYGDA